MLPSKKKNGIRVLENIQVTHIDFAQKMKVNLQTVAT